MSERVSQALRRDARGIPVVEVRGEIDLSTIQALDQTLDEAISALRPPRENGSDSLDGSVEPSAGASCPCVVMNLSPTHFIDSEGLSALIGYRGALRSLGGELLIVAPPGPVLDLLKLAGVDHLFRLYETPERALDAGERCRDHTESEYPAAANER